MNQQQLTYSPFDPAVIEDPYPVYRELRDNAPLYWSPAASTWVLSRYDDVSAALLDPETYSSASGIFPTPPGVDMTELFLPMLIMSDPPRHTQLRQPCQRLGGIWALWHLPLLVSDSTGQRPPVQFVVALGAMSILFTWVYLGTRGSLLLATLMHAMINTMAAFVFPALQGASYERLWWLYAGVLWAAALAVSALGRGLRA